MDIRPEGPNSDHHYVYLDPTRNEVALFKRGLGLRNRLEYRAKTVDQQVFYRLPLTMLPQVAQNLETQAESGRDKFVSFDIVAMQSMANILVAYHQRMAETPLQ